MRERLDRAGQRCLEIAVVDEGDGIEASELENLFIPFYTTKSDGTGLGLPICQRIVQAHGGEIDVVSAIGRGSAFLVRLPLLERDTTEDESGDDVVT